MSLLALHVLGQQPSSSMHVVTAVCLHVTLHVDAPPDLVSTVQACPSSHDAGQLPSHVSPGSSTEFPHTGLQSSSDTALQEAGQQPSPSTHMVIALLVQTKSQFAALPVEESAVHESPSSQDGQLPSHFSPGSTTELPQTAAQSTSVFAVQLDGQQPSEIVALQAVIAVLTHCALQVDADPVTRSLVQAFESSQSSGPTGQPAADCGSHFSNGSTAPSPHVAEQSSSWAEVQPSGQQPSPLVQAVMAANSHIASQVAADPETVASVQEPAWPAQKASSGQPPSHDSPGSTVPFPHTDWQSASFELSHPVGQKSSPPVQSVIATYAQVVSQPCPMTRAICPTIGVQSSLVSGQAPASPAGISVSHSSIPVTTPSPQTVFSSQSVSVCGPQPLGQQPSSLMQSSIAVEAQTAEQDEALPSNASAVQLFPSSQSMGHEPADDAGSAGSHFSVACSAPSPHSSGIAASPPAASTPDASGIPPVSGVTPASPASDPGVGDPPGPPEKTHPLIVSARTHAIRFIAIPRPPERLASSRHIVYVTPIIAVTGPREKCLPNDRLPRTSWTPSWGRDRLNLQRKP